MPSHPAAEKFGGQRGQRSLGYLRVCTSAGATYTIPQHLERANTPAHILSSHHQHSRIVIARVSCSETMASATMSTSDEVILCCVQDTPVSFDLQASLDKLSKLARGATTKARALASSPSVPIVVLFPEAFLSAYPRGLDFGAKIGSRTPEGRTWFGRYHASSVPVCDTEGSEMRAIRNVAKENGITLVVGVIERCDRPETGKKRAEYGSKVVGGTGSIYCTALTISETGEVLASHRKLMPTGTERLVWGQGDGQGIRVVPTPAGNVGAVICWEVSTPDPEKAIQLQKLTI
ncbi:carbon-nitrogen hydrolase [Moesziomyces antarcticus T-34]|uniref:Carbon-nitrogen hydrolase n=1 Tax=Pseudozyma antarctica (strain T-34) TaxID=1151754 RepID=M9ME53_PSEA3|nr:carbon-nitrogen hydrolase [Moesziomyces antarcticus T-34]